MSWALLWHKQTRLFLTKPDPKNIKERADQWEFCREDDCLESKAKYTTAYGMCMYCTSTGSGACVARYVLNAVHCITYIGYIIWAWSFRWALDDCCCTLISGSPNSLKLRHRTWIWSLLIIVFCIPHITSILLLRLRSQSAVLACHLAEMHTQEAVEEDFDDAEEQVIVWAWGRLYPPWKLFHKCR